MNQFSQLSAENDLSSLAFVQSNEGEQDIPRRAVVIKLVDDGDEDRAFWEYQIIACDDSEILKRFPVSAYEHNRDAAYSAAAEWSNDQNLLIESM